jgi:hypothetical protein
MHTFNCTTLICQRRETPQKVARALISPWVIIKVQLMILLCIPPLSRRQDLCDHAALPPLLVDLLRDFPCLLFLLSVVVENGAAVLRTGIGTLTVRSCGIVHLVEEFEERAVCYFCGVVDDLKCFGVCITAISIPLLYCYTQLGGTRTSCPSTAHGSITRTICITTNVPYSRIVQALVLELSPIHVFHTPKTSCGYRGGLRTGGYVHRSGGAIGHCAERAEEFGQKGHGEVRKKN